MTKYEWIRNELLEEDIDLSYIEIHGILIGEHSSGEGVDSVVFELFEESKSCKGLI